MSFTEATRLVIKQKADFTCCWCRDRLNKVDVHHIIPEHEGGADEEDNAAPLCGRCHDLYGGNPDLRKEIGLRRDQWYEICSKVINPQYGWPIGLDVPLLAYFRDISPSSSIPSEGIQFMDRNPNDRKNPPLLYLSVYFKRSRYFGQMLPDENEKWLYLEANMRFALNLRIQVRTFHSRDVSELMAFLTQDDKYLPDFVRNASAELREQYLLDRERGWSLYGPSPSLDSLHSGDYLRVWRENDENRLIISTFTATHAGISIHARFTSGVARAFAEYLERIGFVEPPTT